MLDRKLLITQGLMMLLVAGVCEVFGVHPIAPSFLVLLSLIFFALALSVRSYNLKTGPMSALRSGRTSPQYTMVRLEQANKDADFNNALRYVFSLPPDEFLKFGRLVTELRYESDQGLLSEFSEYLRGDDESDS